MQIGLIQTVRHYCTYCLVTLSLFFVFLGERRFICTQGPLPTTCDDFWTMIVQERVNAIVMLCDCIELGRQKCHQYWPTKDAKVSCEGCFSVFL